MSFPYDLDLFFGSERSTVDSLGRFSFCSNNGNDGKVTPSFLIATILYNFEKESPSENEINLRNIKQTDFFDVFYNDVRTSARIYVDSKVYEMDQNENYNQVSSDILGDISIGFTYPSGSVRLSVTISPDGEDPITVEESYNSYSHNYTVELETQIGSSTYWIFIKCIILIDGALPDSSNFYEVTAPTPKNLPLTDTSYNYVSPVHLKNLTLINNEDNEILQEWWDSEPEITVGPYPLTTRGTSTEISYSNFLEGFEYDRWEDTINNETNKYHLDIYLSSSGDLVGSIEGDVVYENPSEIVKPVRMPVYFDK